ncbi:High-affinity branched-chain amino acid transport system permease protein LivH [Methylorubrum aminovorans]|uniref:High-affinity branched-chain amino acid transport system permease protein LivH n=1 Tax=Methylorubrum aminovorans TaxID=269069 RepID=A0ABQ4UL76_9HYPH|nr:branched-chain amino acid ABC transporter permease [Methylorubrum aminovorans]GJE68019.1 High-affinity branched-chain amino acid transport system permease protein LivH [Methylorubrum aminovorans]GMA79936.1 branched-chain amino acid ABC transporter permease [Methylorubrum aminovorans]
MDIFLQVLFSGLTVGAMYAAGSISLSLLWSSMGMLNLANSSFIAIGGYAAYFCMTILGASWVFAIPLAIVSGAVAGYLFYHLVVRWLFVRPDFAINIIISTVAVAALVENVILNAFGPEARRQPFQIPGGMPIGGAFLPFQTLLTLVMAMLLLALVLWIMKRTRTGLVIRAVAQQRDAAQLMGIDVSSSFARAMMLAATVGTVSGVLVTASTQLFPATGFDATVKALVICIIAGLGNIRASILMAFVLGIFEIAIQYIFGQRFGFPAMLGLVIVVLIVSPVGLFGKQTVTRV